MIEEKDVRAFLIMLVVIGIAVGLVIGLAAATILWVSI